MNHHVAQDEAHAIGPKAMPASWEFESRLLPLPLRAWAAKRTKVGGRGRATSPPDGADRTASPPDSMALPTPFGRLLFASRALPAGTLPGTCTAVWLDTPR